MPGQNGEAGAGGAGSAGGTDTGAGGANSNSNSNNGSNGSSNRAAPEVRYVDANVESLKARYGGADNAIRRLFRDGKRARDGRRELEQKLHQMEEAQKGSAGSVVLTPEQAKAWKAYVDLGKKPEELATVVKEHGELSGKVKQGEAKELAAKAAKAAGYGNADALHDLATTKHLTIVVKQEKVNEKDTDVAYVTPPGENQQPVKLTEYVDQHLGIYKPALVAAVGSTNSNSSNNSSGASGAAESARRTPFPGQTNTAGASGAGGDGNKNAPPLRDRRVLPSQRNAKATE